MYHPRIWRIFLILLTGFSVTAWSQESQSEIDKTRSLLRQQMETKLREMEGTIGDDGDLGEQIIVKRKPRPLTLSISSDTGEIWSSNVFLEQSAPRTDFATTHNDAAMLNLKFIDELSLSVFGRYSMYRYYRLDSQDFDAFNIGTSINYTLPWEIQLSTGLQWTTIYSLPVNDSVYEEVDANASITKVLPLAFAPWIKDKAAFFGGYQQDVRRASPTDYDKVEYTPFMGISILPHPTLVMQAMYRWQYQDYHRYQQMNRYDISNTGLGSLAWSPFHWLTISGTCSYTHNNSVESTRDYKVFNTGGSIRLSWKF
jgi:hypothetical protein